MARPVRERKGGVSGMESVFQGTKDGQEDRG
jgi:hypothetical protein